MNWLESTVWTLTGALLIGGGLAGLLALFRRP